MASFLIHELKECLPILQACYGFDTIEIASELTACLKPFINEERMDEIMHRQRAEGKGMSILWNSAINIDGHVEICTDEGFDKQIGLIHDLCNQYIQDEAMLHEAKFILVFMAAIFNRNTNGLHSDDIINRYRKSWNVIHPDLLKLFIALNKPRHEPDTPMKIYFKNDSPHQIANKEGWFSGFLNDCFIKPILGDITVEEAEEELKQTYSDDRGRTPNNPYLNYIINGTYNYIVRFIQSAEGKVTVEQCRCTLDYLKIIGQVKDGDTLSVVNTLQSTVRGFLIGNVSPVDKHIRETTFSLLS